MKLMVKEIKIQEVKLPKRLLKDHPEKQVIQIANSIQAFGFNDPVAIDEKYEIIEGVGRVLAAQKLGLETIPTIQLSHLTQAQKKAYRIAHNKITLNTGFDLDALKLEFESLCQLDESLFSFTGFEPIELDELLKLPAVPELSSELTESLSQAKTVTCPHCGGQVHV